MTTPTNSLFERQFRVDLRCSGKSMISQLCNADRGALQRALRVRRQRHACVQGGASSLGLRGHDHDCPHAGPRVTAGGAHLEERPHGAYPSFRLPVISHRCSCCRDSAQDQGTWRLQRLRLFLRPFVRDRLRFPSELYVMVTKAIEPGDTGSGFYRKKEPSLLITESIEPANGSGNSKLFHCTDLLSLTAVEQRQKDDK